jgi:hypothetical protein
VSSFEVTQLFLEKLRNFGPDLVNEVVKVVVPQGASAAGSG